MNENNIQLFAFIALRALAEFDPGEYQRATDMSKKELEFKILNLEKLVEDQEAIAKYNEIKNIELGVKNSNELKFLMKQIYYFCFQKAQYLSIMYFKEKPDRKASNKDYIQETKIKREQINQSDFLRLGVMRFLQELEGYIPNFSYQWRNTEIDCLLYPVRKELPTIIIQEGFQSLERDIKQLKSFIKSWGKNTIGIILSPKEQYLFFERSDNIFFLNYDIEKNIFVGDEMYKIIKRIYK